MVVGVTWEYREARVVVGVGVPCGGWGGSTVRQEWWLGWEYREARVVVGVGVP